MRAVEFLEVYDAAGLRYSSRSRRSHRVYGWAGRAGLSACAGGRRGSARPWRDCRSSCSPRARPPAPRAKRTARGRRSGISAGPSSCRDLFSFSVSASSPRATKNTPNIRIGQRFGRILLCNAQMRSFRSPCVFTHCSCGDHDIPLRGRAHVVEGIACHQRQHFVPRIALNILGSSGVTTAMEMML